MSGGKLHNKSEDSRLIAGHWQRPSTRKWIIGILACVTALQLQGCLSTPSPATPKVTQAPVSSPQPSLERPDYCELPPADAVSPLPAAWRAKHPHGLWWRLRRGFALHDIEHPRIQHEIQRLQRSPAALQGLLLQASPYLHHIVTEVEQRGMPLEIALLPAVESGFRPYAFSHDGAAGLWQFMPATGTRYGLARNWWYDGRRDLIASTEAALTYLQHLQQRFDGDWLHGLAAYNAGGGTVSKAIRKNREAGKPTDFWRLDLPGETDAYVPRLLALSAVISNPGHYGIELPEMRDRPQFQVVATGDQLDLKVAAQLAGMSLKELLVLNPAFNRGATPPEGPHQLLIPNEAAQNFSAGLASLTPEKRLRRTRYRVRSGDNLSTIAARHDIPVSALKTANNLKDSFLRAGADLIIPLSAAEAVPPTRYAKLPTKSLRYKVQKGDSLYLIAQRYSVSVNQLRRWNRLDSSLLRPGQRLTLYIDPTRKTL